MALYLSSLWNRVLGNLVSLVAVFWISRNALPKRALRDIQKTAARETRGNSEMSFLLKRE